MHRLIKDAILEIVPGMITKKRRHKIIEIKVLPHQNLEDVTITIVEKDPTRGIVDPDLEIVNQNLGKNDIETRDPDPKNEGNTTDGNLVRIFIIMLHIIVKILKEFLITLL